MKSSVAKINPRKILFSRKFVHANFSTFFKVHKMAYHLTYISWLPVELPYVKVEKFACTNFRENKISRGLIFATEDFNYFAVTYFREFREWRNFCVFRVEKFSRISRVVDFLNFRENLFSNWGPVILGLGGGTLVFDHPTIP